MNRISSARAPLKAALCCLALASTSASAALVDFNGLPSGTVVSNQFAGVNFSTEAGQQVIASGGFICTGTPGFNCTQDIYIDFASAASNISIDAVQANEFGTVGTFFLYSGATLLGTQDLIGLSLTDGAYGFGTQTVSFTGFSGVTRLEIRGPGGTGDLDNRYSGGGVGWDNLSWVSTPNGVPEPSSLALVLVALAATAHRRKARAV